MKRPIRIDQRENGQGDYWYTLRGGNGANTTTSKMYDTRDGAKRAARGIIAAITPAPVVFQYWSGPTTVGGRGELRLVTERLNGA
ncbi:hypothetical protein B1R94_02155 [Mycolicibacterium litorale]|nr:hypothetical protein B1R94_02155 [Mycolicibacterium litorale]